MSRLLTGIMWLGLIGALPAQEEAVPKGSDGLWYGLYIRGQRCGFLHFQVTQAPDGGQVMKQKTVFHIVTDDGPQRMETLETRRRQPAPPYQLLEQVVVQRNESLRHMPVIWGFPGPPRPPTVKEVRLLRTDDGFEETVLEGGVTRTRKLPAQDGAASAPVDIEAWVREAPAVGDRRAATGNEESHRITAVEYDAENGQLQYEITTTNVQGRTSEVAWYDAAGLLLGSRKGFLETRRESAALAQDLRFSENLNDLTNLRLDRPLGMLSLLKRVVLEVRGGDKVLIDGPGQRVVTDPATRRRTLELGEIDTVWPLAAADRPQYLAETDDYPIRHPQVMALAHEACGNTIDDEAKVQALVPFVHGYLRYVRDARDPSVLELMQSRQGDCTEFARLLVTLARAQGIPARRVAGLVYSSDHDDQAGSFAAHAWVEVAVSGRWLPVDPTSGVTRLHPGYIRFDPNAGSALEDPIQLVRLLSSDSEPVQSLASSSGFHFDFRPPRYVVIFWGFLVLANVAIALQKGRPWLTWFLLSLPLAPLISLILIRLKPIAPALTPAAQTLPATCR